MKLLEKLSTKKQLTQSKNGITPEQTEKHTHSSRDAEIVLNHFNKLKLTKDEFKKFSPSEIAKLSEAYQLKKSNYPWGEFSGEGVVLKLKKCATWKNYDIYATKMFFTKEIENSKRVAKFENNLLVANKKGGIVGVLHNVDALPDFETVQGLVFGFNQEYQDRQASISDPYFLVASERHHHTITKLLSKNGKLTSLYYTAFGEKDKFDIPTHFLTENDKIIKNDTTPIYSFFNIYYAGTTKQDGNWKLSAENGEVLGIKKFDGKEVRDTYAGRFFPRFDSSKNYADVQNYAESSGQWFNLAVEEEVSDLATADEDITAQFVSAQVDSKTGRFNIQIAVFATVRKKETINAQGEVEDVKFYDCNNIELATTCTPQKQLGQKLQNPPKEQGVSFE